MTERDVTPEDFARYVNNQIGEFKCEVCGTQEWALEIDPSIDAGPMYTITIEVDGQSLRQVRKLPACIVSCKHCGNMKMFLRERVESWMKENPVG